MKSTLNHCAYSCERIATVSTDIYFFFPVACLKGDQKVRRPWWAPPCLSVVFVKAAKRNRHARVVSLKLEP
ncbi:hypothetical protein C3L33_11792, partial [Rhododendron williamsianum]